MVKFNKVYSSVLFLACVILFANCGGSEPSAEEKVKKILIKDDGTWEPSVTNSITLDGIDVQEDLFPDFTIRFTADKIFTTGTTPVWLREDTWSFKEGSKGKIIIRGMDDKEIAIEEISSAQLKLTLEWDQTTYEGRAASLPGLYEFILDK
jgi:hypothetical protein